MTQFNVTSFRMRCAGVCGSTFILDLERKEDLSESNLTHSIDVNMDSQGYIHSQGYAIFRDRSFVECPYCHGLCKVLPGSSTVTVDYKPEKK
jgi:hypothetical protein